MDAKKVAELTELANSTDKNGNYDISDATLDRLATTPEGKAAVEQAKQARKK